jgi:hypothetical protein
MDINSKQFYIDFDKTEYTFISTTLPLKKETSRLYFNLNTKINFITKEYYDGVYETFFKHLIEQGKCQKITIKERYHTFACDTKKIPSINFLYARYPELELRSNALNTTFKLQSGDTFELVKDTLYYLPLYDEKEPNNFRFGNDYLRYRFLIFDIKNKRIGLYYDNLQGVRNKYLSVAEIIEAKKKNEKNKNKLQQAAVVGGVSVLALLGLLYLRKKNNNLKKMKKNEKKDERGEIMLEDIEENIIFNGTGFVIN